MVSFATGIQREAFSERSSFHLCANRKAGKLWCVSVSGKSCRVNVARTCQTGFGPSAAGDGNSSGSFASTREVQKVEEDTRI